MIYVGQKFEIPGCGKSGQDMSGMQESMPTEQGPMDGPQRPKGEGRPDSAEQPRTGKSYTVREGDSLGVIAERFGVDVYALASANGIDNMNMIYAGQELRIPALAN
ncbi:MAG: hypothetical protein DCC57_05570 [Chloroflexi bacterium]|nr:MAG: hypothetical protein DCC57_05570 [Chloroflexota bacterium]